jgi:hypothetical protein
MLERATEHAAKDTTTQPPLPGVVVAGRFARDPGEFATRRAKGGAR